MALVLRKAFLPKNISMLKCMKSRPLASTANKKNAPALIAATQYRNFRNKKMLLACKKIYKAKQFSAVGNRCVRLKTISTRYCISCPNMIKVMMIKPLRRCLSNPRSGTIIHEKFALKPLSKLFHTSVSCILSKRDFCSKVSPPPCPPCDCNCLPPPCNTPPKCIQYMTGYYYYPYGFWFCGPYHVTGICSPCGPSPPGGAPCPPPCAKCCACLTPTISAVVDPRPLPKSPSRPASPPRPQNPMKPPQPPETGTPSPQFNRICETPVFQEYHQAKNSPTKQTKRPSISKYLPFHLSESSKPIKASQNCPYSTQITSGQRRCNCNQSSCRQIHIQKPNAQSNDLFPKNPKKYLSGCFSRSFCGYDSKPCTSKCRGGHLCPPLKKPKVMPDPGAT